jgi:sulfur relay (sulfurtransferase) DsrC/TusE family protein
MKTQFKKNKTQFNVMVNQEEYDLIKVLREKYAINLSGAFKIFLKELKEKLENSNVNPHI